MQCTMAKQAGGSFAASVPPVINTMANMTSLSGSLMRPGVLEEMAIVSKSV